MHDDSVLDNEQVFSKLTSSARVVGIKGKTQAYTAVICNGLPIEYRAFCALVVRYSAGFATHNDPNLETALEAFWRDLEYVPPVNAVEEVKEWWQISTKKDVGYDAYMIAMRHICAVASEDHEVKIEYGLDLLPLLEDVASQLNG